MRSARAEVFLAPLASAVSPGPSVVEWTSMMAGGCVCECGGVICGPSRCLPRRGLGHMSAPKLEAGSGDNFGGTRFREGGLERDLDRGRWRAMQVGNRRAKVWRGDWARVLRGAVRSFLGAGKLSRLLLESEHSRGR